MRSALVRRLVPLLLISWLAACQQPPPAPLPRNAAHPQPPPTVIEVPVRPVLRVTSLAGAWRIAAIDGRPLDEQSVLAFRGDQERLWWEPRCAGMVRNYHVDGGSILFSSVRPSGPPGSTPAVCAIGLPPRLDEVFRALDAATTISRVGGNDIHIAGGGRSVTLSPR